MASTSSIAGTVEFGRSRLQPFEDTIKIDADHQLRFFPDTWSEGKNRTEYRTMFRHPLVIDNITTISKRLLELASVKKETLRQKLMFYFLDKEITVVCEHSPLNFFSIKLFAVRDDAVVFRFKSETFPPCKEVEVIASTNPRDKSDVHFECY